VRPTSCARSRHSRPSRTTSHNDADTWAPPVIYTVRIPRLTSPTPLTDWAHLSADCRAPRLSNSAPSLLVTAGGTTSLTVNSQRTPNSSAEILARMERRKLPPGLRLVLFEPRLPAPFAYPQTPNHTSHTRGQRIGRTIAVKYG
jgi:hypothetical protein